MAAAAFFDGLSAQVGASSVYRRRLAAQVFRVAQLPAGERAAREYKEETEALRHRMRAAERGTTV